MAETDSTEATMAESSNLVLKARDLLATPSHEGLTIIVDHLFMRQDSVEYKTARALFDFCVANFSNCLTLMLLKVYRYSSEDVVRFRSIYHLSEMLTDLRNLGFDLNLIALNDIKPLLISCLTMSKATKCDTKILRIIVSSVAFRVLMCDNGGWHELGDCILSLANSDPLRAFNVFLDLPPLSGEFITRFLHKLVEEVYKVVLHPEQDRDEDWTLALETAVKLGIQLLNSGTRSDLTRDILETVLTSADELVVMGMEQFLQEVLEHLVKFLAKDVKLCEWSKNQCDFVAEFAFRIARIGTQAKKSAKKIYEMVTKMEKYDHNPAFKLSPTRVGNQVRGFDNDLNLYTKFSELSALDILSKFSVTELDDRIRETAIRRLHDVLCDHTSGKWDLDVSEIRNLKPLLISCLKEERMPENTFKILGQVIFHVAQETFRYEKDPWFDLWDYIASESKTKFMKAVYIFQCLTMQLDNKDFVIPALNNLLPEMYEWLNPPTELLVDNSCWVLTFTGAFCAAIRLIDVASHTGFLKEIAHKMIDSVKELVERGMEVGLVRRAFRDLEGIVKKQCDWYKTCEYRFVKGLLWKLYTIKGMKMESRIVLWRINAILENKVDEKHKMLPETKLDWLNQPET